MGTQTVTGPTFSLVGPGRVGTSMAHWLAACGWTPVAVAGRRESPTRHLAAALGAEAVAIDELESAGQTLLLVTVSDDALDEVAGGLTRRPQAPVALHVSGTRGAEALAPLAREGVRTGSLHPLRAFPEPSLDADDARGLVVAIDGDAEARRLAGELCDALAATAVEIDASTRPLYHLGAWLAAGGVVTVAALAHDIAAALGLPPEVARGYLDLSRQALDEAGRRGDPAEAITGPVARGDVEVVEHQMAELAERHPELVEAVSTLALETLRLGRSRGRGPAATEIDRIFSKAKERKSFLDPK